MQDALPSTIQEEAALIAALMIRADGIEQVAGKLRTEHFSLPIFGRIYADAIDLISNGRPFNPIIVDRRYSQDPEYQQLGGRNFWANLTGDTFATFGTQYVDHIVDLAQRRLLRDALLSSARDLADLSLDVGAAVGRVEDGLADAVRADLESQSFTFGAAFGAACDRIDRMKRGEIKPGVMLPTLTDWNDITGGMRPGDYIVLGGRPSMGKTSVSLAVSLDTARAGVGVLYISREMDVEGLMPRFLADLIFEAGGKATFSDIKAGEIDLYDRQLLNDLDAQADALPMEIVRPEHLAAGEIAPLIRKTKRAFERRGWQLGLVVIDYLGLIDAPDGKRSREQEISAISATIKKAALANRVPVIALTQLSRAVEQRDDKHPQLSDLRDSGSLEQDADLVVFVYRDEYYLKRQASDAMDERRRAAWDEAMRASRNRIEIYSAKNRQGDLVKRKGYFFGERQAVRNSNFYQSGGAL